MQFKYFFERSLIRLFYGPSSRYQNLVNNDLKHDSFHIISLQKLALVTLALPVCGFIFCIGWSMAYNFADSTSTHCGVANYLPSVSASIGSYSPQKFVWRFTVALHSAPRCLVSAVYFHLHGSLLLFSINLIEIIVLLGLTVISSTEIFVFHAFCFMMFISFSCIGMLLHLMQDALWSSRKLKIVCFNTMSWMLALFFYARHNQYCETGVYSMFAAAEYAFVLSNMIFHFQAYHDLANIHFSAVRKSESDFTKFVV